MTEFNRIDNRIFGNPVRAALDHHHAIFCSNHGDIQRAFEPLGIGRIDHELAIHLTYAHRADRAAERNIGKRQGRSGGVDAHHIGIVIFIRG